MALYRDRGSFFSSVILNLKRISWASSLFTASSESCGQRLDGDEKLPYSGEFRSFGKISTNCMMQARFPVRGGARRGSRECLS